MPLSTADLAGHLELDAVPTGAAGTEFARFLAAATQGVTRMTGWLDATSATATVTVDDYRQRLLQLRYCHLASVDAVRDPTGAAIVPYRVDLLAGLVELTAPTYGTWAVDVTGTAWPAELSVAALDWAAHLYETQRVIASAVPAADEVPAPTFSLPNRVMELVGPYRLGGFA